MFMKYENYHAPAANTLVVVVAVSASPARPLTFSSLGDGGILLKKDEIGPTKLAQLDRYHQKRKIHRRHYRTVTSRCDWKLSRYRGW